MCGEDVPAGDPTFQRDGEQEEMDCVPLNQYGGGAGAGAADRW